MTTKITKMLFRAGLDEERQRTTWSRREPVYTIDTKRVFMGDGLTQGGIAVPEVRPFELKWTKLVATSDQEVLSIDFTGLSGRLAATWMDDRYLLRDERLRLPACFDIANNVFTCGGGSPSPTPPVYVLSGAAVAASSSIHVYQNTLSAEGSAYFKGVVSLCEPGSQGTLTLRSLSSCGDTIDVKTPVLSSEYIIAHCVVDGHGSTVQNKGESTSGTVNVNLAQGRSAFIKLVNNAAITFSNLTTGTFRLHIRQDSTGGWVPTFPANVYGLNISDIDTTPGACTELKFYTNGTDIIAKANDNMPVGFVLDRPSEVQPTGYWPMDGSTLPGTVPSTLFAQYYAVFSSVIVPDRRGRFTRGADDFGTTQGAASNDPDHSLRTGGVGTSKVNSLQGSQFGIHNHNVRDTGHHHHYVGDDALLDSVLNGYYGPGDTGIGFKHGNSLVVYDAYSSPGTRGSEWAVYTNFEGGGSLPNHRHKVVLNPSMNIESAIYGTRNNNAQIAQDNKGGNETRPTNISTIYWIKY